MPAIPKTWLLIVLFLLPYPVLHAQISVTWVKTYGGTNHDRVWDILEVAGGYLVAGIAESNDGMFTGKPDTTGLDIYLMKLDRNFDFQWARFYGGNNWEWVLGGIHPNPLGGYVLAGRTRSSDISCKIGNDDIWVLWVDTVGNVL